MKMRIFKITILLFLLNVSSNLYSKGHIIYLCYDAESMNLAPIADKFREWANDGKMFLYIQNRDDHFVDIINNDLLEEQLLYLIGINSRALPKLWDIQRMNNDLVEILAEYVESRSEMKIIGENDNGYDIDIIIPSQLTQDEEYVSILKRFIFANNFDQRINVKCWSIDSNNFQFIYL